MKTRLPEISLNRFKSGENLRKILLELNNFGVIRKVNNILHVFYSKMKSVQGITGEIYFVEIISKHTLELIDVNQLPENVATHLKNFIVSYKREKIKQLKNFFKLNGIKTITWERL